MKSSYVFYVFGEAECAEVREVLGGLRYSGAVRRPAAQVGSLAALLEWLRAFSAVLETVSGVDGDDAAELDERRREEEVMRRWLARMLAPPTERPR